MLYLTPPTKAPTRLEDWLSLTLPMPLIWDPLHGTQLPSFIALPWLAVGNWLLSCSGFILSWNTSKLEPDCQILNLRTFYSRITRIILWILTQKWPNIFWYLAECYWMFATRLQYGLLYCYGTLMGPDYKLTYLDVHQSLLQTPLIQPVSTPPVFYKDVPRLVLSKYTLFSNTSGLCNKRCKIWTSKYKQFKLSVCLVYLGKTKQGSQGTIYCETILYYEVTVSSVTLMKSKGSQLPKDTSLSSQCKDNVNLEKSCICNSSLDCNVWSSFCSFSYSRLCYTAVAFFYKREGGRVKNGRVNLN